MVARWEGVKKMESIKEHETCLTRDEKSREEMTAVGGRSWGKEAGWVTDGGMERCDRQGPRAAGKRREEECVKRQKMGSAGAPGATWPAGAPAGAPAGLRRGRVSSRPSRPSLVSLMPQEEARVFD